MKKNIYLIQPTFLNTSSIHFPYAIGALASYAWNDSEISEHYNLHKIFFLREKISDVVSNLSNPYLIGFSNYIWNFEYNKALAKAIKEVYPECIVIFGGPQISENADLLNKYSYIDILIYYEGEVAFKNILKSYIANNKLSDINNISFRSNDKSVHTTPFKAFSVDNFPSPYESGFFDRLCQENPNIDFIPLIETNRGCPNKCSYCSWGKINSGVRMFPLDRVYKDIEWVSRRKMEFLGFADANFGLFPRDEQIVDKIIDCFQKNGYPRKFQVSYSKDSGKRVFNITKRLNENGMDKGVTLSFQSMSETVQKNIGRSNMDIEYYKNLLKEYSKADIPTYTDLILGLPGETVDSFKIGINELLENGQHTSLFVHLCEWLPLSEMSKADYMEKYKLKFTKIPLNQPHMSFYSKDNIQEYSRIITSTYSMTESEWIEMVMFSTCVLSLHHLGLLQFVALYLHYEKNVKYSDFYEALLSRMSETAFKIDVFRTIRKKAEEVINNHGPVVICDNLFGNIAWPFEEYAFLKIVLEKETFYDEIRCFLAEFITDNDLINDLTAYQSFVIKGINVPRTKADFKYNWKEYFDSILIHGKPIRLTRQKTTYSINDNNTVNSWDEYAKKVLWFGRRGGRNIYTTEIQKELKENER